MHLIAAQHTKDTIVFDFYDDKPNILAPLLSFFKENPDMIPSNVVLNLKEYAGEEITAYSSIRGIGAVDKNFGNTIKYMAQQHSLEEGEIDEKGCTPVEYKRANCTEYDFMNHFLKTEALAKLKDKIIQDNLVVDEKEIPLISITPTTFEDAKPLPAEEKLQPISVPAMPEAKPQAAKPVKPVKDAYYYEALLTSIRKAKEDKSGQDYLSLQPLAGMTRLDFADEKFAQAFVKICNNQHANSLKIKNDLYFAHNDKYAVYLSEQDIAKLNKLPGYSLQGDSSKIKAEKIEPMETIFKIKFKDQYIAKQFLDEFELTHFTNQPESRKVVIVEKASGIWANWFSNPPASVIFSIADLEKIESIIQAKNKIYTLNKCL